jgi:non-lysosomal glucosylceramidase
MTRKCNCSGHCGSPAADVTRREFIEIVGAGAAGAVLSASAWAARAAAKTSPEDLERWKRALLESAPPRVYRSDLHTDARLHLGGIGTGNFEIGADGQLTTWQLFNTLRDGHVPLYFLCKAGNTTKLLQTKGGPEWPRVKQIEMTGEYPFAVLRFRDADVPVNLELTAFSPFAPLDTKLSSTPLAGFVFRIQNPSGESQTVSLAALMQNPIGYDAAGPVAGNAHPNYGGNTNEIFRHAGATGLVMRAAAGREPALDKPVSVYATANLARELKSPPADRPNELRLETLDNQFEPGKLANPASTVLWLEDAPADLSPALLRAAQEAVTAGATLIFAGRSMPLLKAYAEASGGKPLPRTPGRPDILFENFEQGYDKWKVEGEAFGKEPTHGTLSSQQRVAGFLGKGLVNSFLGGDDPTGRLTSQPFTIERDYIRFLVGGGAHRTTQIRLIIDGKAVQAASGRDEERLLPVSWNVRQYQGQTARLEIVDEQQGPWGHINVDQIEFSDQAREHLLVLDELLPARFSDLRARTAAQPGNPNTIELAGLELKPEAKQSTLRGGLRLVTRPLGKGQVAVASGSMLGGGTPEMSLARQQAYAALCELAGASYTVPGSVSPKAPGFGTIALVTLGEKASVQPSFDDWKEAWETFAASGGFEPADQARSGSPTPAGRTINGTVAATVTVAPGQTVEVPFLLSWHYPNKYNPAGTWMGCHYATLWPDAAAGMKDMVSDFPKLREKTERFRKTFYDSTLPYWLLDCLTSQAAIIRHIGVVFRIANGDIFGWEGSNGCCQPTCTHVWGYEQTLSRLFPDLEREMRRIDFKHQQRKDGGVNNRTDVPSPARPTGEQPFADGHASCILKAYREALNSADDSFFKDYWPNIKLAVEYLIARDASTAGGQPEGILRDDQWNTYDEALHGVTTFISGYYLAALRAGEEWARRVGDAQAADRFHAVFLKGQENLQKLCWNGEYFEQKLDDYLKRPGEVGPGCMADQLIGQWWAHQLGLGYLLPKERVQAALRSVFKYNWMPDLTGWKHIPRAFAGANDKGLIICTWPKGGRPANVMLYSDEVWTGIEYQVAAHMIYEGLIEEGFAIIRGARDRYDGIPRAPIPRNPWNEIECGGHYARAMSSWSLLLAASGYEYDGPARALRFTPRVTPANIKAFFCGPESWGSLRQSRDGQIQHNEIAVIEGQLGVAQLRLNPPGQPQKITVALDGAAVPASFQPTPEGVVVTLTTPVMVRSGQTLAIAIT